MLIKKTGSMPDKLYKSAMSLATWLKLDIIYKESMFTIKEADEEDDQWFSIKEFSIDDYETFIVMCEQYSDKPIKDCLPDAEVIYKIACTKCNASYMTIEQVRMNTIDTGHSKLVTCINCGELLNIAV